MVQGQCQGSWSVSGKGTWHLCVGCMHGLLCVGDGHMCSMQMSSGDEDTYVAASGSAMTMAYVFFKDAAAAVRLLSS